MNWKIKRDPFYKELFELFGKEGIEEAGFFEDTSKEDVDLKKSVRVLCTPLAFMLDKISTATNPCILLNTGSFCPIHSGHIEMMENSKSYLESIGYDVVGGFISPGHDEYIFSKNKETAIPIHYRIKQISEAISKIDWLSVDPWEGLFCKEAVNFTDVYLRLGMYIKEHLKKDIPIFFISGGDNSRFAITFYNKGNCIIVNRPGYEDRFKKYKSVFHGQKNVHFISGDNQSSSTKIRTEKFIPEDRKKLTVRIENEKTESVINLLEEYFTDINKL